MSRSCALADRPQPVPAPRAAPAGWIDGHTHLWDLRRRPQPWIDPGWGCGERYALADLEETLDSATFGSAVLVQSTQGLAETREFLALAHHSDRVAGVVGWVDLSGDIAGQLDTIGDAGDRGPLVGVRHPAEHEPDPGWLATAEVVGGIQKLGRRRLAYDLLVRPRNFEAATMLAERAPQTRLVLDHCGKPPMNGDLTDWAGGLRRLGRHLSVACKISGLATEVNGRRWTVEDLRPIVETVLAVFGPARTMFGGDWPLCLIAAQHQEVIDAVLELLAPLSDNEREQVFRGTAIEWYGLDGRRDLSQQRGARQWPEHATTQANGRSRRRRDRRPKCWPRRACRPRSWRRSIRRQRIWPLWRSWPPSRPTPPSRPSTRPRSSSTCSVSRSQKGGSQR